MIAIHMGALTLQADDALARQKLAECLASKTNDPGAGSHCEEVVASHLVDGRYCDGNVLLDLDPAGNKRRTCIPAAVIDRKLEIMKKDPLPPRPPPLGSGGPSKTTIGLVVAAVVVGAFFALR